MINLSRDTYLWRDQVFDILKSSGLVAPDLADHIALSTSVFCERNNIQNIKSSDLTLLAARGLHAVDLVNESLVLLQKDPYHEKRSSDWVHNFNIIEKFSELFPFFSKGIIFPDKWIGLNNKKMWVLDFKQLDSSSSRLLMLDRVQDPHNLGACLRSAAAFGVDAVIMPQRSSAPINDTVHQVSCGGSIIVPLVFVNNLSQCISELKDQGIWFVATTEHATQTIVDVPLNRNLCLLMGSEGEGVKQKLLEVCDYKVCIKTSKWLPTLNVSVATGVLLHAMYQSN